MHWPDQALRGVNPQTLRVLLGTYLLCHYRQTLVHVTSLSMPLAPNAYAALTEGQRKGSVDSCLQGFQNLHPYAVLLYLLYGRCLLSDWALAVGHPAFETCMKS
jgi:hypothetical protein